MGARAVRYLLLAVGIASAFAPVVAVAGDLSTERMLREPIVLGVVVPEGVATEDICIDAWEWNNDLYRRIPSLSQDYFYANYMARVEYILEEQRVNNSKWDAVKANCSLFYHGLKYKEEQ